MLGGQRGDDRFEVVCNNVDIKTKTMKEPLGITLGWPRERIDRMGRRHSERLEAGVASAGAG